MRAVCLVFGLAASIALSTNGLAADLARQDMTAPPSVGGASAMTLRSRVRVIDGRTLWFPDPPHRIRLAEIDVCELPQWAFDPTRYGKAEALKPVPCGALAKAWLKRFVGDTKVTCHVTATDRDNNHVGTCFSGRQDLAIEMLRVGWARVRSPSSTRYLAWQRYAMNARLGLWATYVLDMDEWRANARDTTLGRHPSADLNLLAERKREITPPFADARRRFRRGDR